MPGAVGGGLEPGWWQGVLGLARGCWHYGTPQNPLPTLHPSCPPSLTQPVKGWGGFPSPSTPKSDPPFMYRWARVAPGATGTPARRLPWV